MRYFMTGLIWSWAADKLLGWSFWPRCLSGVAVALLSNFFLYLMGRYTYGMWEDDDVHGG